MSSKQHEDDRSELCTKIRRERRAEASYESLVESYSLELVEVIACAIGQCDCEDVAEESIDARDDEPWREKFVIETLYIDEDMRFTEMSKHLDCHSETAKKYVDKFDVSPIDSSNRTSSPRVNRLQRLGAETGGDIEIKRKSDN